MLYSSGVGVFVHQAKQLGVPVVKKAETSDPTELNTDFFMVQLGHVAGGTPVVATERVAFAKPRGPPRRR
jgi:twinfilin